MQEKIWRERQQAQLRNEAAQYLEGRIARDPMAGPNHHSLAPILQELGDHDEALRRLQFAAKANPENLNVRNDLALGHLQERQGALGARFKGVHLHFEGRRGQLSRAQEYCCRVCGAGPIREGPRARVGGREAPAGRRRGAP